MKVDMHVRFAVKAALTKAHEERRRKAVEYGERQFLADNARKSLDRTTEEIKAFEQFLKDSEPETTT